MEQKKEISERKKQYLEKLKDPRWQKKRLQVFERDMWHVIQTLLTVIANKKNYIITC